VERCTDLAIGAPGEGVGGASQAGAVTTLHGREAGLVAAGGQLFPQDSTGVPDAVEPGDRFGAALAAQGG
jgi:hypothetical protein